MDKKYFKLHNHIRFLGNDDSGCIYNTLNGDMIKMNSEFSKLIKDSYKNIPLKFDQIDTANELVEEDLGSLYDVPTFIEEPRAGAGNQFKDYLRKRVYLKNFYFQISNKCNLNCVYCDESSSIFRPTSCKKWNNVEYDLEDSILEETFRTAKNIGCENIHLIGGEPFLNKEKLTKTLALIDLFEFNKIFIYTNLTLFDDTIGSILNGRPISVVIELPCVNQETYRNITKTDYLVEDIINNVLKLNKQNIETIAHYSVSKYNEKVVNDDIKFLKEKFDDAIIDFVYPIRNTHYSNLYKDQLYHKQFPKVSNELITVLEDYNSDLYGKIYLNLSGKFTPCPMINQIELGDIKDTRLDDVLKTEEYEKLIRMSRNKLPKCKNCNYRLNCLDIRSVEYSSTGKIDGVEFCNE